MAKVFLSLKNVNATITQKMKGDFQMKIKKQLGLLILGIALVTTVTACGSKNDSTTSSSNQTAGVEEVIIGVAPGPYGDMATEVISPLLEEKGYTLVAKQFNDYVQPNKALDGGQIGGNLFQHTAYLEKFSADNKLEITGLEKVPTLGMGIYSNQYQKLADLPEGGTLSIANDAVNLARTLQLLAANGLITLAGEIDETKATVDDIAENPKNFTFKTLEAAQLARSLDTVDAALVPGNFAWAADLNPADALALETLKEEYKNVFAVRTVDADNAFSQAVTEVLQSQAFKDAIADSPFKDFDKPAFWNE